MASEGHRISVDKSYKTKVKVMVRKISRRIVVSTPGLSLGPKGAGDHSGLASRSLAMPIRLPRLHVLSALVLLVTLTVGTPLWAQKDAGAIVGLVRDQSGAVVSGAKVTVTDADRGTELTLSTNDAGEYVASPLKIGHYTVTVEKKGFKKSVAGPVQVNIQDRVAVDLKLDPGMTTEVVIVTGERAQLETETSELGQVVDAKRINALPLNGRNYAQLALLGTGIAVSEPGSRVETTYGFSSNG